MTVKITKLSAVENPFIRDMIRIEASYMHGDMNGYSVEVSQYLREQTADVNFDLEGLAFMKLLPTPQAYEELKEQVMQYFLDNEYFGLDEDAAECFVELFVVQDSNDDSYEAAAALQEVEVFIFDSEGVKHDTHVVVNGETIHDKD